MLTSEVVTLSLAPGVYVCDVDGFVGKLSTRRLSAQQHHNHNENVTLRVP
jgi:hypothetical protein